MIFRIFIEKIQKHGNYIKFLRKRGCQIGKDCEIYSSANFGSEPYLIKLGNHVRVNSGVNFVTHDGGMWVVRKYSGGGINEAEKIDLFGKIKIGNNVHIGTNATIMPGVIIGDNCIIGCGAVVTKKIPDNSVAVGVPARVIESIDDYIKKHANDFDYTKELSAREKKEYLLSKYLMRDFDE